MLGHGDGEQLLELIDGEHELLAGRNALEKIDKLGRRSLSRPDDHRFPIERRQEAGSEERRLAASGRPDNRQQRRFREPRHELGDETLAAEEELRVDGLERREAFERAHLALW